MFLHSEYYLLIATKLKYSRDKNNQGMCPVSRFLTYHALHTYIYISTHTHTHTHHGVNGQVPYLYLF